MRYAPVLEEPCEVFGSPVFYAEERRDVPAGPVLTPGETNTLATQPATVHGFDERQKQSEIACRPSKHWIVFFLSPFGDWSAEDFLMGHELTTIRPLNRPRGRMSTQDERRNISIPPRVTYGALVGESDGEAPYGLE